MLGVVGLFSMLCSVERYLLLIVSFAQQDFDFLMCSDDDDDDDANGDDGTNV